MRYTRTAIAVAIAITAAGPGTQPVATAWGLAGSPPLQAGVIAHNPELRAPKLAPPTATIGSAWVYAENQEQLQLAEWALNAMDEAGLDLPTVVIYLHSDQMDCSSDPDRLLLGYHALRDGLHTIHSCGTARTLVHELGHVWDDHVLDDETRRLILDHQRLDEWHSKYWRTSGTEHLASIIAWGLEGTRARPINYYDEEHLTEAYLLATGQLPPAHSGGAPRLAAASGT